MAHDAGRCVGAPWGVQPIAPPSRLCHVGGMSTLIAEPSLQEVPETLADCSQPCHAGFEGLNEAQRAFRAEIVHRAHSMWECKGRPVDSQLDDWLAAEAEVLRESGAPVPLVVRAP